MGKEYDLTPVDVAPVDTKWRKISGQFPVAESVPLIEKLRTAEARSMRGQPPVIWDRAEGVNVYDPWGNKWLDFSSGVLIANAGHGHPKVVKAITDTAKGPLTATYCFPNQQRARLAQKLVEVSPPELEKVFILSTGAEATECCLKLALTAAQKKSADKNIVVSFEDGFHGRTMGSQLMGGSPALQEWIPAPLRDAGVFVNVPYPDGFRQQDVSFDVFEKTLADAGVDPNRVAMVITETYPGGSACFLPVEYAQALRAWCDKHDVTLVFDEVQAGFGRCGKWFGYQHYGVKADLVACGKGISSSLPLSCVLGRADLMDQYGPGSMTSTHSGSPVCAAAALASLEVIEEEGLVENAAKMGEILGQLQCEIMGKYSDVVGAAYCKGLVGAIQVVKPGTTEPDEEIAFDVILECVRAGVLFFAPVGKGGGTVKISPPLCITEDALREGLAVVDAAFEKVLAARQVSAE